MKSKFKRVVVNGKYTYETDLPVKKGDVVELPSPEWLVKENGPTWFGEITALTSEYDGYCVKILSIVE